MRDGEVICKGAGCYEWTIHNFCSYIQKRGNCLLSDVFSLPDIPYRMKLSFLEADGFLKLKFFSIIFPPPSKLNVKLGMRTEHRGEIEYRSGEMKGIEFEIDAWMKCSEFFDRRREILNNGCLTVFCEFRRLDGRTTKCTKESASVLQEKIPRRKRRGKMLKQKKGSFCMSSRLTQQPTEVTECNTEETRGEKKITAENEASERDTDKEETDSEWKTLKKMQRDLGNLLIDGEDCDVTIKVQGKEFPAHRIILRARSPVFKSMFSHEMVEKQSGVVVIEDCDPDTFPDFLNYVYTGSIKHISDENVFRLYTVSDKYDVKELKEECATFMKNNMSVGTFCDVITLALRHTEKKLIDLATEFFCSNATEITKTAKWQTFLHENTTVGNELFIKAFSKKN